MWLRATATAQPPTGWLRRKSEVLPLPQLRLPVSGRTTKSTLSTHQVTSTLLPKLSVHFVCLTVRLLSLTARWALRLSQRLFGARLTSMVYLEFVSSTRSTRPVVTSGSPLAPSTLVCQSRRFLFIYQLVSRKKSTVLLT